MYSILFHLFYIFMFDVIDNISKCMLFGRFILVRGSTTQHTQKFTHTTRTDLQSRISR